MEEKAKKIAENEALKQARIEAKQKVRLEFHEFTKNRGRNVFLKKYFIRDFFFRLKTRQK